MPYGTFETTAYGARGQLEVQEVGVEAAYVAVPRGAPPQPRIEAWIRLDGDDMASGLGQHVRERAVAGPDVQDGDVGRDGEAPHDALRDGGAAQEVLREFGAAGVRIDGRDASMPPAAGGDDVAYGYRCAEMARHRRRQQACLN